MRIRPSIFPRRLRDWLLFFIVVVFVPFVYLVEVSLVLPYFHKQDSWAHYIHFSLALFAVTNISSNFLGMVLFDTSVPKDVMSSDPKPKWEFCASCEKYAPPRSWHCKACQTCILLRDHHCLFAGCCIGHNNFRYFILFLFYMFVSCLYALVYNITFWYYNTAAVTLSAVLKLICPGYMLLLGQMDEDPLYLLFFVSFVLTLIGFGFSGILFAHHIQLVISGRVTHDRNNMYDLGWRKNVENVLGNKWYLTWIPLIQSRLPHNGTEWVTSSDLELISKSMSHKSL